MFHEGQFEGRKVRLPVFLGRRPKEPVDMKLRDYYANLLAAIDDPVFRGGEWRLCERTGWPDNRSFQKIVAWCWSNHETRFLIVVNLSDGPAQARIHTGWNGFGGRTWKLIDRLSGAVYERSGDELQVLGLYVDLQAWCGHLIDCQ